MNFDNPVLSPPARISDIVASLRYYDRLLKINREQGQWIYEAELPRRSMEMVSTPGGTNEWVGVTKPGADPNRPAAVAKREEWYALTAARAEWWEALEAARAALPKRSGTPAGRGGAR